MGIQIFRRILTTVALIVVFGLPTFAQAVPEVSNTFEKDRLAEEQRHNHAMEIREWLTLVGGIAAAGYGFWKYFNEAKKRRDEADRAFRNGLILKALELAMQAESPSRAESRLKIMKMIVPALGEIKGLSVEIDKKGFGFGSSIKRRQELIALLAVAPPDRRQQILSDWHRAFPNDKWVFMENGELVLEERRRDKAEIRALIGARIKAVRTKDLNASMSCIAPNILSFDVVNPLQYVGSGESKKRMEDWFSSFQGPIGYEMSDIRITASDDVAFAHGLSHVSATSTSGSPLDMWWRTTLCFHRIDGKWLVTHEHNSVPFDMQTNRASLDLKP